MKPINCLTILVLFVIFNSQVFSQDTKKIVTVSTNQAKLTENESKESKVLKVLQNGEKLELIEIIFPDGIGSTSRYKVKSGEIVGFITSYFVAQNVEIQGMESSIKELELIALKEKELERKIIEDSLKEVKRKESQEYLEKLRVNEENEIRKNDSIAEVMLRNAKAQGKISYQNNLKARREKYYPKYGKEIGEKIATEKIWIGMTEEMLLDSWGKPEDINQTVTRYSNRKQYVYGIGQYVYVENGKVEAWQN